MRRSRSKNELRVLALRSRRKNPVGRTRGGEDLGGELWRFHLGRSVAGARAAAQRLRSDAFGRARAGWRHLGHSDGHWRWWGQRRPVACRGTRRQDRVAGWEKSADHGPMADLRGSVRMKVSRPW